MGRQKHSYIEQYKRNVLSEIKKHINEERKLLEIVQTEDKKNLIRLSSFTFYGKNQTTSQVHSKIASLLQSTIAARCHDINTLYGAEDCIRNYLKMGISEESRDMGLSDFLIHRRPDVLDEIIKKVFAKCSLTQFEVFDILGVREEHIISYIEKLKRRNRIHVW